jgi:hypothetical protein
MGHLREVHTRESLEVEGELDVGNPPGGDRIGQGRPFQVGEVKGESEEKGARVSPIRWRRERADRGKFGPVPGGIPAPRIG